MRVIIKRIGPNGLYHIPTPDVNGYPTAHQFTTSATLNAAMRTAKNLYHSPSLEVDVMEIEGKEE